MVQVAHALGCCDGQNRAPGGGGTNPGRVDRHRRPVGDAGVVMRRGKLATLLFGVSAIMVGTAAQAGSAGGQGRTGDIPEPPRTQDWAPDVRTKDWAPEVRTQPMPEPPRTRDWPPDVRTQPLPEPPRSQPRVRETYTQPWPPEPPRTESRFDCDKAFRNKTGPTIWIRVGTVPREVTLLGKRADGMLCVTYGNTDKFAEWIEPRRVMSNAEVRAAHKDLQALGKGLSVRNGGRDPVDGAYDMMNQLQATGRALNEETQQKRAEQEKYYEDKWRRGER